MWMRIRFALIAFWLGCAAAQAQAQTEAQTEATLTEATQTVSALPPPSGEVLLTVRGDIARTNGEGVALLDLALLEAMGLKALRTRTIWTDGEIRFEGIELARLIAHLGADGSILRMTALNDYAIELPIGEAVEDGPLLALRMDGVQLSPRDKGPVWMVYPYDSKPEYKNEVSYSRSIWQLSTIEVLP